METKNYIRIMFIPNFNASKEYLVVPAADLNEQISLPGEEVCFDIYYIKIIKLQACTTISQKFIMNGSMLLGSKDSTNLSLAEYIGKENIALFGEDYYEVKRLTTQLSDNERAQLIC